MFIAGCLGTTDEVGVTGQGLTITDFYSSYSEVEGKDRSVSIYLEAENQGASEITNVLACLIGSNFPGSIDDGLWSTTSDICQYDNNLAAYDEVSDIPGGSTSPRWRLKSPCLPETLTRTDQFTGRVYYDYNSSALTSVWVYSEGELRAAQQRGETIPSTLTVETTKGPISMSLEAVQPVRADDESFILKVTFSNVGGGTVFSGLGVWDRADIPDVTDDQLNFFTATLHLPSGLGGESECNTGELSDIELRRGQSITRSCDVTIDETVATKKSYPIAIVAEYGYYIDDTLSIVTKGKRGQTCF